ncbi:MAG: zinc-binding alcohol dehydrogenase family protein [Desulfurococcaceae archaeon]
MLRTSKVWPVKAAVLYKNAEIFVEGLPRRSMELPLKEDPLTLTDLDTPAPSNNQVLVRVEACGVCYTDIDIIEGRIKCKLPIIPGHQVIGKVVEAPKTISRIAPGDRVGIAWIAWTCSNCDFCKRGLENLCVDFKATGCHIDGGYAEYTTAYLDYVYRAPVNVNSVKLAPLMCAGAVGYRALRLTNMSNGLRLGLFGFGASAHIIIQVVRRLYPDAEIYVFSRSSEHRELARRLGADWTGHPQEDPPARLDRAIDFTPVGETVKRALELLNRGGRLVINVIRKQTPVNLVYENHLWEEKEIKSVANVTRRDIEELLRLAAEVPIDIHVEEYELEGVNIALRNLKSARIKGSAVLRIS